MGIRKERSLHRRVSEPSPSSKKNRRSKMFNDAFASRSYSNTYDGDGQGVIVRLAMNVNILFQSLRYLLCRVSVVAVSMLHRSLGRPKTS